MIPDSRKADGGAKGKARRDSAGGAIGMLWLGGVFVLLGLFIFPMALWRLLAAQASSGWPTVPGRVTQAWTTEGYARSKSGSGKTYEPHVRYEYTVDGRMYTGRKVSFTEHSGTRDPGWAGGIIRRYAVGTEVRVHYRPGSPDFAVLEPGVNSDNYIVLGIAVLCMVGGGVPAVIGAKRWRGVIRRRAAKGFFSDESVREQHPRGREIPLSERPGAAMGAESGASAYRPPAGVTGHSGEALAPDADFFYPPPAEIGPVRSAQTTLRIGQRHWTARGRVGLMAAVVGPLVLAIWGLTRLGAASTEANDSVSLWVLIPAILLAFGVLVSPAVLYCTGFVHRLTYVGAYGVARYVLETRRDGVLMGEVVRFDEVERVEASGQEYGLDGKLHRVRNLTWRDAADEKVLLITSLAIVDRRGALVGNGHDFHFAAAAERAWVERTGRGVIEVGAG